MNKVYQMVQEQIIAALEKAIEEGGTAPWCKPWVSRRLAPQNFITKKPYRGVNLLLLDKGGYYLTFRQIVELQKKHNIKLKKGSKSHMVVFWTFKQVDVENKEDKDIEKHQETVPIFRYYNVFHQSDIEGFENLLSPEEIISDEKYKVSSYEDADNLIDSYSDIVPITYADLDNAYYSPKEDSITVPPKNLFKSEEEYYSTIFHEMVHSTGYESRLNRLAKDFSFGDHNYSKEELVAEIGSSMLCAEFGIEGTMENSTAYLYSWLSQIKKDITLVTSAAQAAQKACDYILQETGYCEKIFKEEKGVVVNA